MNRDRIMWQSKEKKSTQKIFLWHIVTVVQSLHTPSTPQGTSLGEQQGGWKGTYFSDYNGICIANAEQD